MANDLFPAARSAFARGELDWESDTFKVLGLDGGTYDATTGEGSSGPWEFATDIDGAQLSSATLAGKTVLDGGVCDADNATLTGVDLGETITALVIIQDTGTPATSRVVYWADTNDDTTAISLAGDGGAIVINWSASANRVFRL